MKCLLVLAALAYVVSASYTYHGHYPGSCGYDGLYYKDDYSFIYCSNGNSYVQPCAPGTRNSPYGTYSSGGNYGYRDFCDINLVDYGYAAYGHGHGGYGNAGHGHGGYGNVGYGNVGYGNAGYGNAGYGGYGNAGYGHGNVGYGNVGYGHGH